MEPSDPTMLVIESDIEIRNKICRIANSYRFRTVEARDTAEAVWALSANIFDLALVEARLCRSPGLDIVKRIHDNCEKVQVFIMTNPPGTFGVAHLEDRRIVGYLRKPISRDDLKGIFSRVLQTMTFGEKHGQGRLVGNSLELEKLKKLIAVLSLSRVTVLLTGETGTGKELVARVIHGGNPKRKPFVAIDCGSLPDGLIESELFGHAKGAFTGAIDSSMGLLMAATGGTLFLDEVGELTLQTQAKLLRVLQEREVRAVGSQKTTPFDVRVIAASNRDLDQEIRKGRFRKDLYYRLSVVSVLVPPLRSRKSDIEALLHHFLRMCEHGRKMTISSEAIIALREYDWPGNIRELEHCIEAACVLSEEDEIAVSDLPAAITQRLSSKIAATVTDGWLDGDLDLRGLEKKAIESALQRTNGDVLLAARKLGMGKTTLYRKMKEYRNLAACA